ncbi:MAG: hypothetical protein ACRDBP_19685, partial [Luteolibacter sp.]
LDFAFKREGLRESYSIETNLPKPLSLLLEIAALRDEVQSITVNGKPATFQSLTNHVGSPRISITAPPAASHLVVVEWKGNPVPTIAPTIQALNSVLSIDTAAAKILEVKDPQNFLKNFSHTDHRLSATASGILGHRSAFLQLNQGDLTWWQPVAVELRAPAELIPAIQQNPTHLRFSLRNNTRDDWSGEATITVSGRPVSRRIGLPAGGVSEEIAIPADNLPPGSHPVSVVFTKDRELEGTVVNWKINPQSSKPNWETVDLSTHFNDKLTRIFSNEYRSPRSPYGSLAIPKQGIGGWCYFATIADIDDSGLRDAAGESNGIFHSPLGIPFKTPGPGESPNIIFTSQWDNYPDEVTLPLTGRSSRVCLLMAGSTNAMQCRFDNGAVIATYADGSTTTLTLHSPVNWWPIEQDYHIDSFAFSRPEPVPPRLDLKSAKLRVMDSTECKSRGALIAGGAATLLDIPLDRTKELKSLTVRTNGNEVIIGLMAVTLARD